MSPQLAVVILAGGQGRRIGGDKANRLLGGVSLIDRVWKRAEPWSDLRAIAGGSTAPADAAALADHPGLEGPLGGVAAALDFASTRGASRVLTLACDTPFLPDDLADRLSAAMDGGVCVAVPQSGDRRHFACAMWRADIGPALAAWAVDGRRSLSGVVDSIPHLSVAWPVEPFDPFFNVNTPGDLATAEAWLATQSRLDAEGAHSLTRPG